LYILDIDDLREITNTIGSKTSDPGKQFDLLNSFLQKNYRIHLPSGLKYASIEKFGDVVSSPLVYERATNCILKRKIDEGEDRIIIKNPDALYRIGILGYNDPIEIDLIVEGNVGNFFAASCNFKGTWIVKGHAENGLADKGYSGKVVVEGLATELVGQNNQATKYSQGVDILVKKGCMERAMGQARGGSLVTFGAGYNSGLYMSGGIMLDLGPPGEEFGPGMVGGVIYARSGTTVGEGAFASCLNSATDYDIIANTLRKFQTDLHIQGLNEFSIDSPVLNIANNNNNRNDTDEFEEYNFKKDFIKIIPGHK
jgi:formylmethanofuran dehydrogenase subunit C